MKISIEMKKICYVQLQQHHQTRRKLFEISHSLRSMMYGQDRYRRRYWVLPHCGGVFIEAMESGEGSYYTIHTKGLFTSCLVQTFGLFSLVTV